MNIHSSPAGKLSHWFIGFLLVFVAIFGFATASHAVTEATYTMGLIIGGVGLFGLFMVIKRAFDTH